MQWLTILKTHIPMFKAIKQPDTACNRLRRQSCLNRPLKLKYERSRAAQIPIDGSTCVFVDANNGRIYTKRFDYNNGSFPFDIFQRVQPSEQPTEQYVTLEQFQAWKSEIEGMIHKPIKGGAKSNE